jgi:predicted Na+-dependent transporter
VTQRTALRDTARQSSRRATPPETEAMLTMLFRHATTAPLLALGAGLLVPGPASLARDVIGPVVLVLVFGAIAGRSFTPPSPGLWRQILLTSAAAALLAPAVVAALALLLPMPAEAAGWMVLAAAAPIAVSAGTVVRSLGMSDWAASQGSLVTMLASPITVPAAIWLFAGPAGPQLDIGMLSLRLALFVLAPTAAALLLRRLAPHLCARRGHDLLGLSVLALAVLALARAEALAPALRQDPAHLAAVVALATMVALAAGIAVAAITCRLGTAQTREGAIAGALRNASLVWGALSERLPPAGELFIAASALPFYLLPLATRPFLRKQPQAVTVASLRGSRADCRSGAVS